MPLLLLFVLVPILEIWLLIKVGGYIGALPTIALVLLTAIMGVALLKQQSLATMARARQQMASGAIPLPQMVEGIFLAVGGALLLTPGFFTDAIGFACLIPGIRQVLIGWGAKHIKFRTFGSHPQQTETEQSSRVIEGEYKRED